MGVGELLMDMHDDALKPRILNTLLNEFVPDEKKPFDCQLELSRIVFMLQTHNLLSELFSDSMNPKLVGHWKSAVDDWVNRLLFLVSVPSMPDKCRVGIYLLGVTCQQCSPARFLASYAIWFEKLYSLIQSPKELQFLKVASCVSVSDLITRLAGFPNAKKDGNFLVGKLIQPILKILKEENSEDVLEGAIELLYAVISSFPTSLRRNYGSVEAVVASTILSRRYHANMQKKLAHTLALLPMSRGDKESWLSMMQNILLLVNGYLSDIFQGLETETKQGQEAIKFLVPPGEVAPLSIWGQTLLEETSDKAKKRAKISSIFTLIICCQKMLGSSYLAEVNVPVQSLLALVERVLMVNGSLTQDSSPFVIAADQAFVCSELPLLHSCMMELLASIIKNTQGKINQQQVPHIVRLVKELFKRCELPALREKVYVITKLLLMSMGGGRATCLLAEEVVSNALFDLKPIGDQTLRANTKVSTKALSQPCHKKRKRGGTACFDKQNGIVSFEVEAPKMKSTTSLPVQIAALEALEALLNVAGGWRSDSWRSKVDNIITTVATDCCSRAWLNMNNVVFDDVSASRCMDLQLASLHALLASLLSPSHMCPPHLSLGLELFRTGTREIGTRVSEFCCRAVVALQVLIHRHARPIENLPFAGPVDGVDNRLQENPYSGARKLDTVFLGGIQNVRQGPQDMDDDLKEEWLRSSKKTCVQVHNLGKNMDTEKPSLNLNLQLEEITSVLASSGASSARRIVQASAAARGDKEARTNADASVIDLLQFPESTAQLHKPFSASHPTTAAVTDDNIDMVLTRTASKTTALGSEGCEMVLVDANILAEGNKIALSDDTTCKISLLSKKSGGLSVGLDNDSPSGSIPDIVDVEPDSDSD